MMSVRDELQSIADKVREEHESALVEAGTKQRDLAVLLAGLGLIERDSSDYLAGGPMYMSPQRINDLRDFINEYFSDVDFDALLAGESVEIDDIKITGPLADSDISVRGQTISGTTISSLDEFVELISQFETAGDTIPDVNWDVLNEFDNLRGAEVGLNTYRNEVDSHEQQISALKSKDTEEVIGAIAAADLAAGDLKKLDELGTKQAGTVYEGGELEIVSQIREAVDRQEAVSEEEDADRVLRQRNVSEPVPVPEAEPEAEKPEGAFHPIYGEDTTQPDKPEAIHPMWSDFGRTPEQMDYDAVAGFASAFLEARDEAGDFLVGLTSDGRVVRPDDPAAVETVRLDEIFRDRNLDIDTPEGIEEIKRLTRFTDWYRDNSDYTRDFQAEWYDKAGSLPQQQAMLTSTALRIEAVLRDLGQIGAFSEEQIYDLAFEIQSVNQHGTDVQLRRAVIAHIESDLEESATSTTAQTANDLQSLARKYFITLTDEQAADYALQIYSGTVAEADLEMMWRDQAKSRFPTLSNYLDDGRTVSEYFASYEAEMSNMFDRPVDLYTEFPQVFDYVADTGEQRPMTFGEMREFARRMPEWQQSQQGQDQARSMSFALAQMFGQAA